MSELPSGGSNGNDTLKNSGKQAFTFNSGQGAKSMVAGRRHFEHRTVQYGFGDGIWALKMWISGNKIESTSAIQEELTKVKRITQNCVKGRKHYSS